MNAWAGIDPGSTQNAFALAVTGRNAEGIYIPLVLREWIPAPGAPLDLRLIVLPEIARVLRRLHVTAWATDSHAPADVRLAGAENDITTIMATSDAWEHWRHALTAIDRGRVSLCATGHPDLPDQETLDTLRSQLATVQRRPASRGGWDITIPVIEGLHGDLAVAWARSMWLARAADDIGEPVERVDLADLGGVSRVAVGFGSGSFADRGCWSSARRHPRA